ncbi:unnamed protein product [Strongylus vulgaris]|uniref:Uncharacterized protein n=1 Tax=Strongylus vulgaris TaxID=40348 RepID=A0A3P7JDQ2_STRVU|nr:unnamed protein product [Strongylus vulgaris]
MNNIFFTFLLISVLLITNAASTNILRSKRLVGGLAGIRPGIIGGLRPGIGGPGPLIGGHAGIRPGTGVRPIIGGTAGIRPGIGGPGPLIGGHAGIRPHVG